MAESQNIEWKESWHDEHLKWICGFANAQGGRLYIGKDDKGSVIGLSNSKKLLEDIPNKEDLEASNEQLLDNLNLLDDGMLKRAAILLFHHNPEKWIPGAYVKIGYFESDSELRYQDEIHGSLISQADRVVDLIYTKYLKAEISYQGVTRVETYPFPKEGIREAVYNSIAHKFYGALIPIQISVYADKLYIANDCVFPDDWTVDDLMGKHRSRPYNPLVANTFFRAGFIKAWGRGIEKIKDSCIQAGNPLPEYVVKREDIMVMFKGLVNKTDKDTMHDTMHVNTHDTTHVNIKESKSALLMEFCSIPRTREEMQSFVGIINREYFRKNYLRPLLSTGQIKMTIPDKPRSRNQKYVRA